MRIHVNGIRGKSTVSRIIAGVLREAGLCTIGKTTGSAACFVMPDGSDLPIRRRAAPTILEQIEFIKNRIPDGCQAIVVECMAIRPDYQRICETKIVQSNIGVITNIREDHQDVMGQSLEEIAQALANTCPANGVLITSEQNSHLVNILREEALKRNSRLVQVDPAVVSDDMIGRFPYVAFKENIAIALAVATLLKIPA